MRPAILFAAAVAALSSAPVGAQSVAANNANAVKAYVRSLLAASDFARVARLETAICPVAYGLDAERNRLITARMRAVSAAAGLSVDKPGCPANVLLFIAKDRGQLFADLKRDRAELFGLMPPGAINALARDEQPATAWQLFEQRGGDGRSMAGGQRETDAMVQTAVTSSRLAPGARFDIRSAVVVMDARALVGLTVTEIADYAMMRALLPSRLKAASEVPGPSILNIFAGKAAGKPVPLSITSWDLAFLNALYGKGTASLDAPSAGEIEQVMARQLASVAAR